MRTLVLVSSNESPAVEVEVEAEPDGLAAPADSTLVREFETAPGLPWEQQKAAQLQARLNAPVPIETLRYKLLRTQPWRPRERGRFAVVYAKRNIADQGLTTGISVHGQSHRVAFRSPQSERLVARQGLAIVASYGLGLAILAGSVLAALSHRDDLEAQLQSAENRSRVAQSSISERSRAAHDNALLARVVGNGGRPSQVDHDLRWLAEHHAPAVHIDSIHWREGLLAVESRGSESPVAGSNQPMQHSVISKGVNLWGLWPDAPQH